MPACTQSSHLIAHAEEPVEPGLIGLAGDDPGGIGQSGERQADLRCDRIDDHLLHRHAGPAARAGGKVSRKWHRRQWVAICMMASSGSTA